MKVTCLLGSALVLLSASIQARIEAVPVGAQNTAVPTNASLERRDQPVTDEDVRILQRAQRHPGVTCRVEST